MRYNPFEPFTPSLMEALRKRKKRWLVSQTLKITFDDPDLQIKQKLLLSHYEERGMAIVHQKAVLDDPFAALIDLEKENHRRQVLKTLQNGSGYLVFSSLIRSKELAEKKASELYKEKYWQFIRLHSHTAISPTKSLRPSIQLIFGELFIVLKYGRETFRTRLSDIDAMP